MNIPTREDVIHGSEMCPILHETLMYWKSGNMTWEQAIMYAALELDIANKHLQLRLLKEHERRAPVKRSQIHAIGSPPPKTWADYRQGCLGTYHGGYRTEEEVKAFQHGMNTVFNLLESELPNLLKEET